MAAAKTQLDCSSLAAFRESLRVLVGKAMGMGLLVQREGVACVVYPSRDGCDFSEWKRQQGLAQTVEVLLDTEVGQRLALDALGADLLEAPVLEAVAAAGVRRIMAATEAGSAAARVRATPLLDLHGRQSAEVAGKAPTPLWFAVIESVLSLHGLDEPTALVDTILSQMPVGAPGGLLRPTKASRASAVALLARITITKSGAGRPKLDAAKVKLARQGGRFTLYGAARAFAAEFGAGSMVPAKSSEAKRRNKRPRVVE